MRVAMVSNFWYRRGGLEQVMLAEAEGLTRRDHIVGPFASRHPSNEPSPYEDLFPSFVDHGALGRGVSAAAKAAIALRLFWNREATRAFDRFVDVFEPDLVHQHGTSRQLSVAVLERAHQRGIPTVLTLHDHSLRCPASTLSRPGAPECVQVSCLGHRYDRAVRFACVHGSHAASAVAAVELLVARVLRRYERSVDLFLLPSDYLKRTVIAAGLSSTHLRVLTNGVDLKPIPKVSRTDAVLAVGRLITGKGFETVIQAAGLLPDVLFEIAGDGPQRTMLEELSAGQANVRFLGQLEEAELLAAFGRARMVVVPSAMPETFGMVVLEAWRAGRPVIASRSGALGEIVNDGQTGLLFERLNAAELAWDIRRLSADDALRTRLAEAGHRRVQAEYSLDRHLHGLEAAYAEVVAGRSPSHRATTQ